MGRPSKMTDKVGEPQVTVVIPTRNRLSSLRRAVESALYQANVSLEVVIVDDGSEERVDEHLGLEDHRLRIVRIDRSGGPAMAREAGVSAARGSLVAFLDDDDYWLAEKLERCLGYFEEYPEAGVVFHDTGLSPEGVSSGGVTYHDDAMDRMLLRQPPHLDGVLVRKSIHSQIGFDPELAGAEDLDYLIGLAMLTPMVEIHQTYAVIDDSPRSSHVAMEQRIQGRQRLRQKYGYLFEDRSALSFWYLRFGHLNRLAGHPMRSLAAFVRSVLLNPRNASAWRGMALAMMPNRITELAKLGQRK